MDPLGHVVGHLKALNVKSLFCFHSTSSLQVFVSTQSHFQCQISNLNIVSSFILIVSELFLNKRVNEQSSLLCRQLLDSFWPESEVVFAKNGASLKLELEFCLNLNKSSFSATAAATAD